MKIWALVKNGVVENKIVADDSFMNSIKDQYEYVIELKDTHPNIGDKYFHLSQRFDSPHEIVDIDVNPDQEHLRPGIQKYLDPFILTESGHEVSVNGEYLDVGCKRYKKLYVRDAFYKILNGKDSHGVLYKTDKGVRHSSFEISKQDMKQLLEALEKLC